MRVFQVAKTERSHINMRYQFAGEHVSFFELLLGYPAFSGREKEKLLKSRHNHQDSPGPYTDRALL